MLINTSGSDDGEAPHAAANAPAFAIRLVRADEHRELRAVRLRSLAYTPDLAPHLAHEAAAAPEFWIGRAARASVADETATFVAVRDGAFVGVADGYVARDGSCADIGGMWVSPDARRSGIGSALLTAVCEWAGGRGAWRIQLHVREENIDAVRLYERTGFAIVERTPTAAGASALRMEKQL